MWALDRNRPYPAKYDQDAASRHYVNQDGNKVYATNVIVEEHYFAEGKKVFEPEKKEDTDPDGFMNLPEGEELPFD